MSEGYIYFLEAANEQDPTQSRIKIGFSKDPQHRMGLLQTGMPFPLHLRMLIPGTRKAELALHVHLSEDRIQGEWFRPSETIRKIIETGIIPNGTGIQDGRTEVGKNGKEIDAKGKRLNLYIPPGTDAMMRKLRHLAIDNRTSLNDLVFRAIAEYVERNWAEEE